MKKILKIALISSVVASSLSALTLNEAVNIALEKNQDLQMKNIEYSQSIDNISISKSSFLPKLDLSYTYNNRDKALASQYDEDGTFLGQVSWNLFNGFKDQANLNISKYASQASQYYLESLKHDTILQTKQYYINYLNMKNALETYNVQYELFQKQYDDSLNKYNQGLMSKNDLLQVQVNMSSAKQNVTKAKANLEISKLQLSNFLGGVDLSKQSIESLSTNDFMKKDYDKEKLKNRSEIQALNMALKSQKENNKVINASYMPKLDAKLSHYNYFEDSAFGTTNSGVDEQNVATLSLSWNLYNGNSNQTQKVINKKEISKIQTNIQKTKLAINLQYENAISNLDVSLKNLQTAKLALEQANENYKIVKNRFDEGISSSTDLIDANYLLTQAKQRYYQAYFDKYLSYATLNRVFEIK